MAELKFDWVKKGRIFVPDGSISWMKSHATLPIVVSTSTDTSRCYFGTRDSNGRSRVAALEFSTDDPSKVFQVYETPVLDLGKPGTFDDCGVMPSWLVRTERGWRLYYIGWNVKTTVPYHLAVGVAESADGLAFTRVAEGPARDRSFVEPYFATAPCVQQDQNDWRMWYVSCTGWMSVRGRHEPLYHIRHTRSPDGLKWLDESTACIVGDAAFPCTARPCVFREGGAHHMIFSYRHIDGYREDHNASYRLGYARSCDGVTWDRCDRIVGIERSVTGWDSTMMEYCWLESRHGRYRLFYNGDGFGASGLGYAEAFSLGRLTNETAVIN